MPLRFMRVYVEVFLSINPPQPMQKYLEEKYNLTFIDCKDRLWKYFYENGYKESRWYIEDIDLEYLPITHQEEDWVEMQECWECEGLKSVTIYKTIIDVEVEDLTEFQKEEQRKYTESLIERFLT